MPNRSAFGAGNNERSLVRWNPQRLPTPTMLNDQWPRLTDNWSPLRAPAHALRQTVMSNVTGTVSAVDALSADQFVLHCIRALEMPY